MAKEKIIKVKEKKIEPREPLVFEVPKEYVEDPYKQKFYPIDSNRTAISFVRTIAATAQETTVANSTDETDLGSLNLQSSELNVDTFFRITANGIYGTSDAVDTCEIKLKIGSTTYHTITTTAEDIATQPWFVKWTVGINTIGSSGVAKTFLESEFNATELIGTDSKTLNTLQNQKLSITADWSAANASNTLTIREFIVEALN